MKTKTRKYECSIQLGSVRCSSRKLLWVSGAEFVDDSVVIKLSPERVAISSDLASNAAGLLAIADNCPAKYRSVGYSTIDDVELSDPSDVSSDLLSKYKSAFDSMVRIYGVDGVRSLLGESNAALSEEVPGNE